MPCGEVTTTSSFRDAVDIFAGKWAADLSPLAPGPATGAVPSFSNDIRMRQLAAGFGHGGRIDGLSVLELGPLEGGHTYHLARLGAASVLAIESNVEAYLKCLVTKELAGLKNARFLLGDFVPYLETTEERYDIVLCSGVLYHMAAPFRLIDALPRVTSKCFVWTHYYDAANYHGAPRRPVIDPAHPGIEMYAHDLQDQDRELLVLLGGQGGQRFLQPRILAGGHHDRHDCGNLGVHQVLEANRSGSGNPVLSEGKNACNCLTKVIPL